MECAPRRRKKPAAEEKRIKAAAAEDARKIVESAQQEIAAAAKSARRELTAYAADLAVSLAKKQIMVDAATDQATVTQLRPATLRQRRRDTERWAVGMASVTNTYARAFAEAVFTATTTPTRLCGRHKP